MRGAHAPPVLLREREPVLIVSFLGNRSTPPSLARRFRIPSPRIYVEVQGPRLVVTSLLTRLITITYTAHFPASLALVVL